MKTSAMSDIDEGFSDSDSRLSDNSEMDAEEGSIIEDKTILSEKSKENLAWADAMAKILKTNKPKRRKTIVLSRAKRLNQIKPAVKETLDFEIEGEDKKPETKSEESLNYVNDEEINQSKKLKKKEWASRGLVKPSVLEKDREKVLMKIATRGVVQLFNTVREHQKTLEKNLEDAGPLEHKKDKVLKSLDKRAFLDVLMGPAKSQPVSNLLPKEIKEDADNPTWSILRDDFMMSSKLKDWDKHDASGTQEEPSL